MVQLKDLDLGAKLAAGATHDEWKSQPAQTEVPEEKVVEAVQAMLRQIGWRTMTLDQKLAQVEQNERNDNEA